MNNYKFFQNRHCEYFPCHKGVDMNEFNCLFCYCPLYVLNKECGGDYYYLENGIKSCELCSKPHNCNGYQYIQDNINKLLKFMK